MNVMAMSTGTGTAYGGSGSPGSEAYHDLEMTNVMVEAEALRSLSSLVPSFWHIY
jgi:hypothetical protein